MTGNSLNIPADEIWEYGIEGMPAPSVNKPVKNAALKKTVFIVTILLAVSLSLYFGIRSVSRDTFEYEQTENGVMLSHFSNTGDIKELEIDCFAEVIYEDGKAVMKYDEEKPITEIGDYALNCDEVVESIHIGKSVKNISSVSFYTCKALKKISVDENNAYYCDIDGVLYNKDCTELICCPVKHSLYTAELKGYENIPDEESDIYEKYSEDVLSFTVPESVKTIGALAFNYTDIVTLYLPEGLENTETMAFFKAGKLKNIYSYSGTADNSHSSFPSTLENIGSDAFSYTSSLEYVYIPMSVKSIGHHAFWDSAIKKVFVEADEEAFSDVETGTHWLPQTTNSLINKSAEIEYGAKF